MLYGLLGHCWIFQYLAPNQAYRLPRGVVAMMLIWLLVCLSGVIDLLGFGSIANGAHVGGLLVGCLSGLLGGAGAASPLSGAAAASMRRRPRPVEWPVRSFTGAGHVVLQSSDREHHS